MSRKYKFHDSDKLYFISFATINWIDVFVREEYMKVLTDSFAFCQEKKGLEIYGWCIMPSHVHMIIGSENQKLENIIRDLKSHTSTTLKDLMKNNPAESRRDWIISMMKDAGRKNSNNNAWQFWQQHNQPLEIVDAEMFFRVLDYIHLNPVLAGLVSEPEHWKHSSAIDFTGKKGLIRLHYIS